jgi:thiamine pyrophosphate-dependent acetolactate synthase large subunit-like protein
MYMALPEGAEIQFSYQFGAVGQGLPLAIGTGAGNPGRPHIAIEGDGSMLFHIQELDTVTRFKLQMVLIVWNDGGYGAEVHKLVPKGFEMGQAHWDSPDFVAIAKAFGGDGVLLNKEADLPAAVAEGLRKGGLYLIDVRVSPTAFSDPHGKVYYGVPSQAPLLRPVA